MTNVLQQAQIDAFVDAQIPVVLCSTEDPERRIPSVNIDNVQAGRDALLFLASKECKRIAFVSPDEGYSVLSDERLSGAKSAIDDGHELHVLYTGNGKYESALSVIRDFLEQHQVDGVIAASDELGLATVHAAQDLGQTVPKDLRVLAFDNTRLAQMVRPELSVVAQPMYDFGAVSMRLLTKLLQDEPVDTYSVTLRHNIMERQST